MTIADKLRSLKASSRIDAALLKAITAHIDSMAATDLLKDRLIEGMTAQLKLFNEAFEELAAENIALKAEIESIRKAQS